jgi:LytS/YehU family sensor histidine kinase
LRGEADFVNYPLRRMVTLLVFAICYTIPVFLAMILAWYRMAGMTPDWHAIRTAVIVTVVCTIFIVHDYETMYLIRQRAQDQASMAQLARSKAMAELAALRAQIDPHFLFNCLNTLAGLIEEAPSRAQSFTICLADVYRYLVRAKDENLVPLEQELAFLDSYYSLMQYRFEGAIELRLSERLRSSLEVRIAPASLQLLLENAVKHNEFSLPSPLVVQMDLDSEGVVVWNEKRPRRRASESSGMGLENLDERCRLQFGRPIEVVEEESRFTVRMPVSGLPLVSGVRAGLVESGETLS